jgi:hypothetical protein
MGGRGAASGVSAQGYQYGTEFKTVMSVDNIKFVQYQITDQGKSPRETMSSGRNRVYVILDSQKELKSITFYDKSGKLRRQIDLDHTHLGEIPHVHIGYNHSKQKIRLTKSDLAYVEKVKRLWNKK